MLTAIEVCGVEQAKWVTPDHFMHAAVQPANRLFEAADSYLNAEAALMPVGHGASGGFLRVKDHEEFGFVEGKELPTVAWIEAQARNPVFSIFDV